jgi:hypothetical protein
MKKTFLPLLFLAACASASVELRGHTFTFQHTDTIYELKVIKNGAPATGLNIQGQIINMEQRDIYYAPAEETSPGKYAFTWTPQAGDYYVQYVFRADNTTLKPTFPITISENYEAPSDVTAIHWHSRINITLCGEPYYLPLETGDLNKQHTHGEQDRLHLHAMITPDTMDEQLMLGNLFSQLNIIFNNTCFEQYCNNDLCNGKPGMLSLLVNGEENKQFNTYSWKDNDTIQIKFG